jgi:hypothetical protein
MSLYRVLFLLVFGAIATCAVAADAPQPITFEESWLTNLDTLHLVPWFTGAKRVNQELKSDTSAVTWRRSGRILIVPPTLSGYTCLKLRTYQVKRQERFQASESAARGYSTCQLATNYQIRSTVEMERVPAGGK